MSKFSNSETTKLLKNLFTHSRCATHLQHFVLIYDIIIRSETWNSNATPLRILKLSDRTFPDPPTYVCMHVLYVDENNKLCGILHLSKSLRDDAKLLRRLLLPYFFSPRNHQQNFLSFIQQHTLVQHANLFSPLPHSRVHTWKHMTLFGDKKGMQSLALSVSTITLHQYMHTECVRRLHP